MRKVTWNSFFDMLIWVFGSVQSNTIEVYEKDHAQGHLQLEKARVSWFLSINFDHIPENFKKSGKRTYRSITVEKQELEFSEGFTDLHTLSYEQILAGKGYGIADASPSIQLVHDIRRPYAGSGRF